MVFINKQEDDYPLFSTKVKNDSICYNLTHKNIQEKDTVSNEILHGSSPTVPTFSTCGIQ